jgi:hypothetical protein
MRGLNCARMVFAVSDIRGHNAMARHWVMVKQKRPHSWINVALFSALAIAATIGVILLATLAAAGK